MKVAVLVPCYNEEATIARVVKDFRAALDELSSDEDSPAVPPVRK